MFSSVMGEQVVYLVLIFLIVRSGNVHGNRESYDDSVKLINTLIKNGSYNPQLRPLRNQSEIMVVNLTLWLHSLVDVDEVAQSVTLNGVLMLFWYDEILVWNPADYSGVTVLSPMLEDVWKPRINIVNTLGVREPFQEDKTSVLLTCGGGVFWNRADLFPVSCIINPTDYPFDEQECSIQFMESNYFDYFLLFGNLAFDNAPMDLELISTNTEWEIRNLSVITRTTQMAPNAPLSPVMQANFIIKRRPNYPIITVVLPAIFLSYLNTLVFVIPVESGEKVSYGITVLLAQSVYMTEMSNVLPKSSITLPTLSLYIFSVLIMSVATVVISIIVVGLNHLEQEQTTRNEEEVNSGISETSEVRNNHVTILDSIKSRYNTKRNGEVPEFQRQTDWKLVSRRINNVSFVLSTFLWLLVTIVFFLITMHPSA